MADQPEFRRAVTGEREPLEAQVDETEALSRAGRHLTARCLVLADGTRLRQHRPVRGQYRPQGYRRLDNEILAGRELCDLTEGAGCPPEVSRFYGDDDDTADDPFALLEPYRGAPLSDVGDNLIGDERTLFHVSLLRGLCWLAAAGIAHRALSPETVWWDGERAQITDFSLSTVFGVPRTPVPGPETWVPKDLREATFSGGPVGPRDDIWAAGRLIFHVWNGGASLRDPGDLAHGGLDKLIGDALLRPPADRPTASELLHRLGETNPAGNWGDRTTGWRGEREAFLSERRRLHPGALTPPEFCADLGDSIGPRENTTARDWAEAPPPPAPAAEVLPVGPWPVPGGSDAPRWWPSRRRHGEK